MRRPTLLYAVLEKRAWLRYEVFVTQLANAGARAATHYENPRLTRVKTVTKTTFQRWLSGTQEPRGEAAVVIEFWLGYTVKELLGPAPERELVLARSLHDASLAAAHSLDVKFDTSFLSVAAPAPGAGGVWHLDGLRILDGTAVAVQMYETALQPNCVVIGPEDLEHLRYFTQSRRRALLLGSLGAQGASDMYALDAAHARRQLAMPVQRLPIPIPYRLDYVTYALLWAGLNVDDSLLADDRALHVEQQSLESHLEQGRSSAARTAYADLSNVGALWLGSRTCAAFVHRHLNVGKVSSVMWSRMQFGEQAAAWLLFRERHGIQQLMQDRSFGLDGTPGCALCVPESAVHSSEPYERLLLLLAVALMESYGLNVWVCAEEDYSRLPEFHLGSDQRVIVADWLDPDAVWNVESIGGRGATDAFAQAIHHAQVRSVASGATPHERIRALADYLGLSPEWAGLVTRCRELGSYGTAGLLRTRSRLIHTGEIDRALQFLGGLGPAS
ncbi:hypothetical protein ACFFS2_30405 [Streptomyces aurantiacus]|uniref:Uncharacterized protein n=1 Tax=Streptomyces aurantiacus TaxID=47760 RepID=A0A7G1NYR5_9ACTN|nr:hypothetical protein [Streptomyces aurantiacus]BCL28583.1 hypothetical protein GCM10017557_34420 [Streptomyces aurantiacus]